MKMSKTGWVLCRWRTSVETCSEEHLWRGTNCEEPVVREKLATNIVYSGTACGEHTANQKKLCGNNTRTASCRGLLVKNKLRRTSCVVVVDDKS